MSSNLWYLRLEFHFPIFGEIRESKLKEGKKEVEKENFELMGVVNHYALFINAGLRTGYTGL